VSSGGAWILPILGCNMKQRKFLFISAYALYPPLLRVAELLTRNNGLEGYVIAPEKMAISTIYSVSGSLSCLGVKVKNSSLTFHFLSNHRENLVRNGFNRTPLKNLLRQISPDFVWVHDEFHQGIAMQILEYFRSNRQTRIIAYMAINHLTTPIRLFSKRWPFLSRSRLKQLLLWPRLDGVVACATKSADCARRIGLAEQVPVVVNYLPVLGPEAAEGEPLTFPWEPEKSFTIGFVGALTQQKGWKILLKAVESLPERFKVVLVGDGEQRHELETWLRKKCLQGRALFLGPLSKGRLLATYTSFDVLVLPSITLHNSVEQFGAVLAEAMACRVPVIGSNSGAIPEVIGGAGLVVSEGDPIALAHAIYAISQDHELQDRLVTRGLEKFRSLYCCEAYANSLVRIFDIS
jgi:glycosyltransferase involved in cell wall biosynthesis